MALTTQQKAFIGVYGALPHQVNRFFTRRLAKGKIPFMTNMTTIVYEEVEKFARKAKILQRGAEFPAAKLNGSKIKSVTPEIIKDSFPFFAEDTVNRQAGDPVYINGQEVNNMTYERDRRISGLKQSIETVMEEISAGVFLEGKYVSPDTKNEVKYTFAKPVQVKKSEIQNWALWLTEQKNAFTKDRKVSVTETLVGKDIFYAMIEEFNKVSNQIIPMTAKSVMTADGDEEMHANVFGHEIVMLPSVTDTNGKEIDYSKKIMFYNQNAYLPAYAGVVNVDGGKAALEKIDVLIRETPANIKTGDAETLGESAYCPIVTNATLIKIVEIDLDK